MRLFEMHVLDATLPSGDEGDDLARGRGTPPLPGTGPSGEARGVWSGQELDEEAARELVSRLRVVEGLAGMRYDSARQRFLIEMGDFREDGKGPSLAGIARFVEECGDEMGRVLRVSMINRTIE